MPNMILDNFSELLLAIKEDEILKKKLIDICKLPAQQRIVEAEKLSFENKQLTLASVMHLLKNDLIANEIVKYLTETDKKTEKKFLDIIKEKPLIFIIPLIAIVIILAVMVVVKSGGKTNHPTGAMTIEVNNKLVLPTNYQSSPLVEYQKIMNEKDEQSVILKIEKFFEKFPNSDYTEDLKVKYLTLLFKTNQTDKIPIFLEKNMDYNQRYFFQKIDVLLDNNYLDYPKKLITEQLTLNYDLTTKLKLKFYLARINDLQKKYNLALHSYLEVLKDAEKTFEYYDEIFLRLSNIYRTERNDKKLENILINAANNAKDLRYKVLALMMYSELLSAKGEVKKMKDLCQQILNLPEQRITYNLLGRQFYTSYSFATFMMNKID